uniref:ZP domain-containing protein n=1 Tax=Mesocestoides corti TaxID=53468 RepID=A0A5K3G0N7_MESCO
MLFPSSCFPIQERGHGECGSGGAVFNENVLSYANVRYSVDSDSESRLSLRYRQRNTMRHFEVQRILIWPPTDGPTAGDHSVFYYCEYIGDYSWQRQHGSFYNALLSGDVMHSMQSHPESGQTSSVCPWYTLKEQKRLSSDSRSTSVYDISFLFTWNNLTEPHLTNDFCPWSYFDGGGTWNILGGLFCEQRHCNWTASTCTEVNLDGNYMALLCNNSCSVKDSDYDEESKDVDKEEGKEDDFAEERMQEDCGVEEAVSATQELYVCDVEEAERGEESLSGDEGEEEETHSSLSSITYESEENTWYSPFELSSDMDTLNNRLRPRWRWILRQTRWPFRFAPQQTVDLSMHEISIPTWRASAGRLISDVRNFCTRNRETKNLILLDPMALSPLSPLLNLMQHSVQPKAHLRGILWMTAVDALSPSYCVPIPRQGVDCEDEMKHPYPRPLYLRFLTVAAFVSNWFAWFSRIETYLSLGTSRFPPLLVFDPVAGCVLQPYTLGCGQTPLVDLWPLWLARRLLLLPFHLPRLCGRHVSQHFFPFTDLDEI